MVHFYFDWQHPFFLPRDEGKLHDYIWHFVFLNPSFSEQYPLLPDICPAYIVPILCKLKKYNIQDFSTRLKKICLEFINNVNLF